MPQAAWQHYFAVVKDALADVTGLVLKTDVWNERRGKPGHGGIIAAIPDCCQIEIIDTDVPAVKITQEKNRDPRVRIKPGNILHLPWCDSTFDAVVDCSTIDHVEGYEKVLAGYARVLKPHGKLVLFVWVTHDNATTVTIGEEGTPAFQCLFPKAAFKFATERHFKGKWNTIPDSHSWDKKAYLGGKSVIQFVGEKR